MVSQQVGRAPWVQESLFCLQGPQKYKYGSMLVVLCALVDGYLSYGECRVALISSMNVVLEVGALLIPHAVLFLCGSDPHPYFNRIDFSGSSSRCSSGWTERMPFV